MTECSLDLLKKDKSTIGILPATTLNVIPYFVKYTVNRGQGARGFKVKMNLISCLWPLNKT
jgi:hypothetical protein